MFLDFTPGYWLSIFRDRLSSRAPEPEMRIMTKRPSGSPNEVRMLTFRLEENPGDPQQACGSRGRKAEKDGGQRTPIQNRVDDDAGPEVPPCDPPYDP